MDYTTAWTRGPLSSHKKQLIVAIDHGLSFPDIDGLHRPLDILSTLLENDRVDGVIASSGLYRTARSLGMDLSGINRLLTVDHVQQAGNGQIKREIIISPEDASLFQPDCFKMYFNYYADSCERIQTIKDFSRFAMYGHRNGISCLAEVLFFGNPAFEDEKKQGKLLYEGCRLAMELGADCLKIPMIRDTDAMGEMIDRLKLPTFILGGSRYESTEEMTQEISRLQSLPICGLMFGRNIWQSPDPSHMIYTLTEILAKS